MTEFRSKRKDNRGHWPAGKSRHPDAGNWTDTSEQLARLLSDHHRPGVISRGVLAAECGVSDRAVTDWLRGVSMPSVERQGIAAEWVAARLVEITP